MIIKMAASSDASSMAPAVIKASSGSHHLSKKQKHRGCREKRMEGAAGMPRQRWDIGTLVMDSEKQESPTYAVKNVFWCSLNPWIEFKLCVCVSPQFQLRNILDQRH